MNSELLSVEFEMVCGVLMAGSVHILNLDVCWNSVGLVVTRKVLVHEIFEMLQYLWQITFLWFYV